jgi:ornithine carbamoyltransferase
MNAAKQFDFQLRVAVPEGYEPDSKLLNNATSHVELLRDPLVAAQGADLIATDVWASMGQEQESSQKMNAFTAYQVNAQVMAQAKPDAIFLHCLPAHRGEEVTAEVIDGPQSRVWDEAENRLHAQKALLEFLLLQKECA